MTGVSVRTSVEVTVGPFATIAGLLIAGFVVWTVAKIARAE
jgi:hypothetical protein